MAPISKEEKALSRGVSLGTALLVIIPLVIAFASYGLNENNTQVNHEGRLGTVEKAIQEFKLDRQRRDDKLDLKLDEFQKSLNRIEINVAKDGASQIRVSQSK